MKAEKIRLSVLSLPLGNIPQNLSREELKEKYIRPEFFITPDLYQMSTAQLKAELKKLNDLRNVGK